jgi:hypothetical protein
VQAPFKANRPGGALSAWRVPCKVSPPRRSTQDYSKMNELMSRLWDQIKDIPQKEPELALVYLPSSDSWELVNVDPPKIEEYGSWKNTPISSL